MRVVSVPWGDQRWTNHEGQPRSYKLSFTRILDIGIVHTYSSPDILSQFDS
jgi:hypothetical protein